MDPSIALLLPQVEHRGAQVNQFVLASQPRAHGGVHDEVQQWVDVPMAGKRKTAERQELKKRRAQAPRRDAKASDDIIDLESEQSFPASDPPSWTPVTRDGAPKK